MTPMSQLTVEKLVEHQGHELATAIYGRFIRGHAENVALVCETCQMVLADWDQGKEPT